MAVIINEELFRQHSPVTGNTALTEFLPYLSIAQELYIAPVLGDALLDELTALIAANSLTAPNSALIVKIAPALSFYAVYQGLPFHWASIVNKGVTIRDSENSKSVDIRDIAQLRRWIKDDAEALLGQLIDFLNKNRADYPLWRPQNNAGERFDSGFYFR
ncbi:MAG: hypothetical protein LBR34_09195 [Prevotella sp.]|jgi:hypothetical protein|nr:hypothetical protein [Prevotella sp.]